MLEETRPCGGVAPKRRAPPPDSGVLMPTVSPRARCGPRSKVSGRNVARVTADTARLRQLLDALGLRDVDVPEELDGETAMITLKPMVMTEFDAGTSAAPA